MAVTSIADVVVPEIFEMYLSNVERNLESNAFFQSGIILPSTELTTMLDAGGSIFNIPFWKTSDISSSVPTPVNEGDTLTTAKIEAGEMAARRQFQEKAWSNYDVARLLAGSDPTQALLDGIVAMWDNVHNRALIASTMGIVADNIANDSSDLVNDITTAGTTAFNSDDAIDTLSLMSDFAQELGAVAVHPKVYATLQKNNLIAFEKDSENDVMFATYLGKRLIVDKMLVNLESVGGTPGTPVYYSVFYQPGAFAYGQSSTNYQQIETDRVVLTSGGQDVLVTRQVFGIHPEGFAWSDTSVSSTFPSVEELKLAVNWDRVVTGAENCSFVVLKSLS